MANKYKDNADEEQQAGMQNVYSLWNALSGRIQQQQLAQAHLQAQKEQQQLEFAHDNAKQQASFSQQKEVEGLKEQDAEKKKQAEYAAQGRTLMAMTGAKTPEEAYKKAADAGIGFTAGGVKFGKEVDATDRQGRDADRRQSQLVNQLFKIKNDYGSLVGSIPQQLQAAENVKNAISSDNKLTKGRIKAMLPLLEGEKFRPTDAERKIMLGETGVGKLKGLKNFFSGDEAEIDEPQKQAILGIIDSKVNSAKDHIGNARKEVIGRWSPIVKNMKPDEFEGFANTLGSSSEELMKSLGTHNQTGPRAPQQQQAVSQAPAAQVSAQQQQPQQQETLEQMAARRKAALGQ